MKIAISGKGGVGKTTLAALLGKTLADEGRKVILIDADPDGNLPEALGIERRPTRISEMKGLIAERTETRRGDGKLFKANPTVSDIPDKYAVEAAGVKLLVLGTIEKGGGGCACSQNAFLRALLNHLVLQRDEVVIADMEAGIEHLGRATVQGIDALLVVVEPGLRSVETAKRVSKLAAELGIKRVFIVLNKVRAKSEEQALAGALGALQVVGVLPYDERLVAGDLADGSARSAGTAVLEAVKGVREKLRTILRK